MNLTKEQWAWLVKAPEKIECGNGNYYKFIQTWDDNGDPIVEMIKYGNQYIKEIFSPHRKLNDYFQAELHYVWEVWKAQQQSNVIHLTTNDILDRYKHLSINEVIFPHINITIEAVKKADKIILHHNGKTKILKNRYE